MYKLLKNKPQKRLGKAYILKSIKLKPSRRRSHSFKAGKQFSNKQFFPTFCCQVPSTLCRWPTVVTSNRRRRLSWKTQTEGRRGSSSQVPFFPILCFSLLFPQAAKLRLPLSLFPECTETEQMRLHQTRNKPNLEWSTFPRLKMGCF